MIKAVYLKLILIFSLVIFILSGCTKIEPVSTIKNQKQEMTVATTIIPTSLEASTNLDKREEDVICMLFEGLVERTSKGDIAPSIAKGWKISVDGLEYSFLIDENFTWSDGEAITANDFMDYFSYVFSPQNEEYVSDELYSIYGLEDYKKGNISFDEVGISVNGDEELVIRLIKEDKELLKKLTKPVYRLRDSDNQLDSYKENTEEIRYTGAYTIKSADENNISLTKNEKFFGEFVGADDVTLSVSGDNIKDFAMYNTSKIDIVTNPPITAFSEGTLIYNINSAPTFNLNYLVFNCVDGITQYLDFRKGLYLSLSNSIFDSYMVSNNLATADFREITADEIEENVFYKREVEQEFNKEIAEKNNALAKEFIAGIPNSLGASLKVVAIDSFESKKILEFLEIEFKKYGLGIDGVLCSDQDELDKILESDNFDIFVGDINLKSENIKDTTNKISEKFMGNEFSIMSLYRKNDYWCKSTFVKTMYVDGNGNLIYKKSIFKI